MGDSSEQRKSLVSCAEFLVVYFDQGKLLVGTSLEVMWITWNYDQVIYMT